MTFVEIVIKKFKELYNIDLEKQKDINIKGMIFPNYCTQAILNINGENEYRIFEYCRIINKIFGFGESSYYEIPEVKIEENDIVFDCGANTGIFSLYSAYKAKKVYAFEPGTLIRHYLRNTQKYSDKITIVPFGLSDKNKKEYFIQTDNPGAARAQEFIIPDCHRILFKELINLITIDEFVEKTGIIPTFIKMDIEDGELNALKGAQKTLKKYHPKCSISIHEENFKNTIYIKSLFPSGYKFNTKVEEYYDPLLIGIYMENKK